MEPTENPPLLDVSAFDVKTSSEEGIKVELSLPDGKQTANYLIVRGADSPTFRKAQARTNRKLLDLQKKAKQLEPADFEMRRAAISRELVATLVTGWNFPTEFSYDAVCDLFEKAPQLMEQVDQVAGQRHHFFSKPSKVSEDTQEKSSGLADQ